MHLVTCREPNVFLAMPFKSLSFFFYVGIFDQVELKNWYINDVKKGEGRGEATVFSKEKVNTMGEC